MAKNTIILVVEGESDYTTIGPHLTTLIDECKCSLKVEIVRGDKTSQWQERGTTVTRDRFEWEPNNIVGELRKMIQNYMKANSIAPRDIMSIYYVTDTDNCFQELDISERKNKADCLKKLFYLEEIELAARVIVPIEIIFFSKNLEHVTINHVVEESNELSPSEKEIKAVEFAMKVDEEPGYFDFIFKHPTLQKWDSFKNSYNEIPTYIGRACNMNNFLDHIRDIRRERAYKLAEDLKEFEEKIEGFKLQNQTKKIKDEIVKIERKIKLQKKLLEEINEIIHRRENEIEEYMKTSNSF